MSEHVTEMLNAYRDGELRGDRLHRVEAHLAKCDVCLAELESLQGLSELLQELPIPAFAPPERFAAQVSLRLPPQRRAGSGRKFLEWAWWMIPVGVLATWAFMSTSFLVNDVLSAANSLGLLSSVSNWMIFGTSHMADWSNMLGQFGVLQGSILDLAEATEAITRMSLPQISLQVSMALLYLSWIAIWWTRQRRQGSHQPLEG